MSSPSVTAVCLVSDRPELTERAVRCFLAQRYEPKTLLLFDSGHAALRSDSRHASIAHVRFRKQGETIGLLRNLANGQVNSDIIMHWDSDDYSHPFRMAEQVAELEACQRDVVGYAQLLFWDTTEKPSTTGHPIDEAWMYDNAGRGKWMPGTSLCYWKNTWRRREFPDRQIAEDAQWLEYATTKAANYFGWGYASGNDTEPRMIAHLHGGNTAGVDPQALIKQGSTQWHRREDFDSICKEKMKL